MNRYPQPWSWQGATAFVLAICLGGGWLVGIVLAALESAGRAEVDNELTSLLNGIGQVIAGAIATYLGFAAGTTHTRRTSDAPAANHYPNE